MVLIAALSTGDHTAVDVAESRRMMRINDYAGWATWEPPAPSLIVPPVHHHHPRTSWAAGVEQWRPLVSAYFGDRVETAMCLIHFETGGTGNPNAKNTESTAAGLFQFLRRTWDGVPLAVTGGTYSSGQPYNPEANIRSAAWLQSAYGWGQWSPYNRGLCHGL